MQLYITENYDEMSELAGKFVLAQITLKPNSVLGLPTGSTPIGMYNYLSKAYKKDNFDFSKITTFNLDEYCGIKRDNPQSYYAFMHHHLFNNINVPEEQVHILNGTAADLNAEAKQYDAAINALGGIDLQVLGSGRNGHIGFNEPAENLDLHTHVTGLTESTVAANSVLFDKPEDMPRSAITMGISEIMSAKKILMLASGKEKAEVISMLCNGKLTTSAPLTLLLLHKDVTIIIDKAAASLL